MRSVELSSSLLAELLFLLAILLLLLLAVVVSSKLLGDVDKVLHFDCCQMVQIGYQREREKQKIWMFLL
jgi:hypothetical protein